MKSIKALSKTICLHALDSKTRRYNTIISLSDRRYSSRGVVATTRESDICSGLKISLVLDILAHGTNKDISIGWGGSAPTYSLVRLWSTLVPIRLLARASPSALLKLELPPHHGALGEFLPDLRRFLYDFTHWSDLEVYSYFILLDMCLVI
jgi:hypothetical protein